MTTFSAPKVKKAIKLAQEMGLPIAGFEVLADGGFRVLTTPLHQSQPDDELDRWLRSLNG